MKRLLFYLFIVFGLGIFVNDHAKANNYCIPKKVEYVFQSIYIFKDCYVYHKEVDLDTFVEFALTHPLQTVGVEKESPLFVEENLKWLKKYLKENNISSSKINKSIKRVKVAKADLSTVKNISSGIWSTFEEKTKINLPKILKKKKTNTQVFNVNDDALKINPTYLKSLNYEEKIKLSKSLYKSANKNFKQKKIIRGCSELYQMSILNAMDEKLFKRAKKRVNKYNCTQYNFANLELNSENVKNAKIICATKSGFSEYRISEDFCNSDENQILNGTDEYYQVLAFIENKTLSKPIKSVNRNYVCSIWQTSTFKIVNYIDETSRCTDIFYEDSHQENYKIFSKYINNVISNDKYTSLKISTKNLIVKKDANKDNFDPDKLKALISKAKNPEPGTYSIGDSDAIVANTISNTVKGCWSIPLELPATEKI